ncbi:ABC transporter permease [Carboxylicivirga mesophila]|uniref:ABC transporter permease n=1 Tax=Carboxylicivirga mesophila TaxID=1166478 RepID=A0ABS5K4S3_9BACT|nr:ABC transporter permease [Carboxylicivirga mesophila]MBS2210007.1 ABC transporter permease [Carboxylicivirga mesophila]
MRQLKQTIRGILTNKQNALFSLIGLSIGLSSIIVIIIWALTHLTFDRFHQDAEQIYFIQYTDTLYNETDFVTPFPLAKELRERIAGMEQTATYTYWTDKSRIKADGKEFFIDLTPTEEQMFAILNVDFIGMANGHVLKPTDIALSQSLAQTIFGTVDCVGKTVVLQDSIVSQVGAVYADFPDNSTFKPEALCYYSLSADEFVHCEGWKNWCYVTVAKVPEGANVDELSVQITRLMHDEHEINEVFSLFPLIDYHLQPIGEEAMLKHLFMVFFSGLLVLIVSCVNFINLQTAVYYKRSRQNSIKKMLGVSPGQLIVEVLYESGIYILAALFISLFISYSLLPVISDGLGLNVSEVFSNGQLIAIHGLVAALVFVLVSAYMVIVVIRTINRTSLIAGATEKKLHKGGQAFVVTQFALAIFIGIAAFSMQKQLSFAIKSDKGYKSDNLMYVETWDYPFDDNKAAIEEYLSQNSKVKAFSVCERSFNTLGSRTTSFTNPEWSEEENDFYKVLYRCDENLFETTQIHLVSGRSFNPAKYNEADNIIINETYAKKLGGDVVGKTLKAGSKDCRIIGVCKDFQFENFYTTIEPLVIQYREEWICNLLIKTTEGSYSQVANGLQEFMTSRSEAPFTIASMEGLLSELYEEEETQQKLLLLFSALTIIISCLGLFGLTAFIIENKTKAIGIRKVNGATVSQILLMLNRNFALYVIAAFVIACPIAWYAVNKWLENFAYKTEVSWWVFALAGLLALVIALATVSVQSWKAASHNPVEALRYE